MHSIQRSKCSPDFYATELKGGSWKGAKTVRSCCSSFLSGWTMTQTSQKSGCKVWGQMCDPNKGKGGKEVKKNHVSIWVSFSLLWQNAQEKELAGRKGVWAHCLRGSSPWSASPVVSGLIQGRVMWQRKQTVEEDLYITVTRKPRGKETGSVFFLQPAPTLETTNQVQSFLNRISWEPKHLAHKVLGKFCM